MSRISYPIESLGLTNTVGALKSNNTPIEKNNFILMGNVRVAIKILRKY